MSGITKYSELIPEEMRMAIDSLNHPIRQAILALLIKNQELAFSDIQKELQIDKAKINFHLKNLFSAALVDHYYRHELGNPKYSYYSITSLGKRILSNLNKAFIPPKPFERVHEPTTSTEYWLMPEDSNMDSVFCDWNKTKTTRTVVVSGAKTSTLQYANSLSLMEYKKTAGNWI